MGARPCGDIGSNAAPLSEVDQQLNATSVNVPVCEMTHRSKDLLTLRQMSCEARGGHQRAALGGGQRQQPRAASRRWSRAAKRSMIGRISATMAATSSGVGV